MATLASVELQNNFCSATRISGESGFFKTITKLFPSGHAFAAPLQYLTRSASGTSASLLPAETTTAMFLMAGTASGQPSANKNVAAASQCRNFCKSSWDIPTTPSDQAI